MRHFRCFRLVLGFVSATALPGLYVATPFLLKGQWHSALLVFSVGLKVTVLPAIMIALPIYLWLRKIGRLRIYGAALGGGAAGAALGLYGSIRWIWLFGSEKTAPEIWTGAVNYGEPHIYFLIGMFCGIVGWLIAFGPRVAPRPL